jgi:type I restriction enzyme, R subunit
MPLLKLETTASLDQPQRASLLPALSRIMPGLQAAGWDNEPHSIAEQRYFTPGRIVVHGNQAKRKQGKRADYILRYTRDFPIAVVEAKPIYKHAADGLQQAKDYAEILGLKFAYATNGESIIEFDFLTGKERNELKTFPTPGELWSRLRAAEQLNDDTAAQRLLTLANLTTGKEPRYYQRIAIDRAVQAILQGKKRILLTLATGTGKTDVAFQICWKLWSSKWNTKGDSSRKPRILYLADRNFLVDDPKDKIFSAFGDARHKIEGGKAVFSREMYFATYQSIAVDENRPGLYKEFAPDFFDLVIVDECHRGSAKEDSA